MIAGRPAIAIRPATPDDAAAIRRVHERSIRALGRTAYTLAEVESWIGVLEDDKYRVAMMLGEIFIVADTGGAGVVAFCSWTADEVKGLYVAPGWDRRGVGSALLHAAEQAITAAGHRRIRIGASRVGEPFYAARGYAVVARGKWKTRGGLEIAMADMAKPVPGAAP